MPDRTEQTTTTTNGESQALLQETTVTRSGTSTQAPTRQVTTAGAKVSTSTRGEQISREASPEKRRTQTTRPGGGTRTTTAEDYIVTVSFAIHVRGWCDC